MIVADASAVLELLLNTARGSTVTERVLDPVETVAAPFLIDLEVFQVLRRYLLSGEIDAVRAQEATTDFADLPMVRYPHEPLLLRVWELRHNLTAYDAAYVALAEALDAPLITADARLADAPGHGALIELV